MPLIPTTQVDHHNPSPSAYKRHPQVAHASSSSRPPSIPHSLTPQPSARKTQYSPTPPSRRPPSSSSTTPLPPSPTTPPRPPPKRTPSRSPTACPLDCPLPLFHPTHHRPPNRREMKRRRGKKSRASAPRAGAFQRPRAWCRGCGCGIARREIGSVRRRFRRGRGRRSGGGRSRGVVGGVGFGGFVAGVGGWC